VRSVILRTATGILETGGNDTHPTLAPEDVKRGLYGAASDPISDRGENTVINQKKLHGSVPEGLVGGQKGGLLGPFWVGGGTNLSTNTGIFRDTGGVQGECAKRG